jgi:hypothetical protein
MNATQLRYALGAVKPPTAVDKHLKAQALKAVRDSISSAKEGAVHTAAARLATAEKLYARLQAA